MFLSFHFLQQRLEVGAGDGGGVGGNLLGCALRDDETSAAAAFGTEVEEVIDGLEDIEIVLNDDDCVAAVNEFFEHGHQYPDVFKVQSGGGLIQNVERLACIFPTKLCGELDALAFAA